MQKVNLNNVLKCMLKQWFVYIIRCADDTLYTGITTDVQRRLLEHTAGGKLSAKYVRGKQPLKLVFQLAVSDRGTASKIERKIKQLSKDQKENIIQDPSKQYTLLVCHN